MKKYKKDAEESNLSTFFDRMFLFKETSIMLNFTTRQNFLVPSFELDLEEREKLDKFLLLLEKTGVSKFFSKNHHLQKCADDFISKKSFCGFWIWIIGKL